MNATLPLLRFASLAAFPGLVHAVSTRQGGVSSGPYASLNLSTSTGDSRENVDANYRRLAAALELPRERFTTTWQVHGTHVVCATADNMGSMLDKADGIISDTPNLPLTQRYADCTPLLLYDPRRHAAGLGARGLARHGGRHGDGAGAGHECVLRQRSGRPDGRRRARHWAVLLRGRQ